MNAIIGRYVRDSNMPFGSELCLDCANAFYWGSSSTARRDVTLIWIHEIHTCTMQGAAKCWTSQALRDPHLLDHCWEFLVRLMNGEGQGAEC